MKRLFFIIVSIMASLSVTLGQDLMPMREIHWPDNIDSANCVIYPEGNIWDVKIGWSSDAIISNHNIPLVGDLTDDGIPEIVCCTKNGDSHIPPYRYNDELIVFDGFTKHVKATITLPTNITANDAAAYGLIKLPDRKGLIVVACCDLVLRAYDITATNYNEPYWESDVAFGTNFGDWAVNVGFADFNNDGHPEVYVRDKIYNAETGVLLAQANSTNTGSSFGHWSHQTQIKLSSPLAANVLGDDNLELILGNMIYSVNITNPNGQASNSITLVKSITPPDGVHEDGHVEVADFNSDGYMDVFISLRNDVGTNSTVYGYVWDLHNDFVSEPFSISTNFSGKSIPMIGDIDNDGLMEVLIQCGVSGSTEKFRAYKYHSDSRSFSYLWGIDVKENSFSNSITAFDFNQDGLLELIICDEEKLRIVNGSGKSHITHNDTIPVYVVATFPYTEITIMQYPVIVDADDDGIAELVSVGSNKLNFLESKGMWAPTRKVWNQYMYNVTNVNNDLTVTQYQFNNATPFIDPDDGEVRYPFNNFLQQATTIDKYGRPFFAATDVAIDSIVFENFILKVYYTNIGSKPLEAPYYITVFANEFGGDIIKTHLVNSTLQIGEHKMGFVSLNKDALCSSGNPSNLVIALNCSGTGIAQNGGYQHECDTVNNVDVFDFSAFSTAGNTRYINANSCEPYLWYDSTYLNTSGTYVHIVENEGSCDSIIMLDLIIKDSLNFEVQGLTDVIVASNLWPGTYNYYIPDSLYMSDCHFTWTCSNPIWDIIPSENSFSCQLIVLDTVATTLTVQADCAFGCNGSHSLSLKSSHIYDDHDKFITDVYPNPSNTSLTVKGDRLKHVKFYETSGQIVKKFDFKLPLPETVVDVRDLRRGVYIVEIETMNGKVFKRVVIY